MTSAPGGMPRASRLRRGGRRRGARCSTSLGHRVEPSHPGGDRRTRMRHAFVRDGRREQHRAHAGRLEREARPPLGAADVEPHHLGDRRDGPHADAPSQYISRHRDGARVRPAGWRRWWTSGFDLLLTPTAGEPPPPLGYFASDARQPARRLPARRAVRRLHGAVQHDRPAGDLAAAALRAPTACRSACSWSPPTGARTCCSASPRSSKRPRRGRRAGRWFTRRERN